jgi:putative endonuclease
MKQRRYHVYIMRNPSGMLYVGMTNDLKRRIWEHKQKLVDGYTKRYNLNMLVFAEAFATPLEAIEAEKRIKGWRREKKLEMIRKLNPNLDDLSQEWFL